MADALLSPAIGAALWAASATTLAWCAKRLRNDGRDHLVPLMGVLGAFIFAAQMLNFTIPGTGSSGHIGGGLLLSILLGGAAAFVVIASVLTVQALFFADGGLLALGANLFNLGIVPCLIAYPLLYRPLVKALGPNPARQRLTLVTVLTAVVGLQLGALGVVFETQWSGISSLPRDTFLLLMQPIHLAIGVVEGLASAAVVAFIRAARPDLIDATATPRPTSAAFPTRLIATLAAVAVVSGGVLSWFASSQPDGLEWSIAHAGGTPEMDGETSATHAWLARLQQRIAPMPDYAFPTSAAEPSEATAWPAVDAGTSTAGVLGGLFTLVLVSGIGWLMRPRRRQP